MNREIIGGITEWEVGGDTDWAYDMALGFLGVALGDPPEGVKLTIAWQDHDYGPYPAIAVDWPAFATVPRDYIRRTEEALSELQDAVDWRRIRPSNFIAEPADEEDSE